MTDSTTRHEVTSWRLDGADDAGGPAPSPFAGAGGCTSHAVLIVDHSGSMRKGARPARTRSQVTRTTASNKCRFLADCRDSPPLTSVRPGGGSVSAVRAADVHGFATRTAAVYDCITRELIQPQLALSKGATNAANMVVSIIQMGDTARVRRTLLLGGGTPATRAPFQIVLI